MGAVRTVSVTAKTCRSPPSASLLSLEHPRQGNKNHFLPDFCQGIQPESLLCLTLNCDALLPSSHWRAALGSTEQEFPQPSAPTAALICFLPQPHSSHEGLELLIEAL